MESKKSVDFSKVPEGQIIRYISLCQCHDRIRKAINCAKAYLIVQDKKILNKDEHDKKFIDLNAYWCAFTVQYFSCFNGGKGGINQNLINLFSNDELTTQEKIEKNRNKFFGHIEDHNFSKFIQPIINEKCEPDFQITTGCDLFMMGRVVAF